MIYIYIQKCQFTGVLRRGQEKHIILMEPQTNTTIIPLEIKRVEGKALKSVKPKEKLSMLVKEKNMIFQINLLFTYNLLNDTVGF